MDLLGRGGYNGCDRDLRTSRAQLHHEDYHSYSWGVVVSVPLTFTTERGRYRAAKLQERQAETDLQRVEQNIVIRVGNAAGQIETSQKRVQATRQAREFAQATLDAEVKRLRAGQSSPFFVSQQQKSSPSPRCGRRLPRRTTPRPWRITTASWASPSRNKTSTSTRRSKPESRQGRARLELGPPRQTAAHHSRSGGLSRTAYFARILIFLKTTPLPASTMRPLWSRPYSLKDLKPLAATAARQSGEPMR